MEGKIILNSKKINQIISRITYQLYENFLHEDEVVVLGIKENGYKLAEKVVQEMNQLKKASSKITLGYVSINKQKPLSTAIDFSLKTEELADRTIVLVDDVLNSGKTMMHILADLVKFDARLIRTVVLVDRKHRNFPVRADFVGLTLSTTVEEHIEVVFEDNKLTAYLE